jgi:PKD repeat protein
MGADNTLWIGTVAESGKIFSLADTTNSVLVQEYSLSSGDRVEIATAESDSNYVYAIIEQSGGVGRIIRTTDHGANWTILNKPNDADNGISAADFSRGQAWYDLIIEVDPNDKEAVVAGAIDLFRSGDGGTSWDQLSHWWGGFGYPYVHADQHGVFFRPGSSDTCLFTNDGGVFYANSMTFPNPAMHARNNGYNVTQFYACDIHPDAGENNYIAGAQDNGTQEFSDAGMNSTDELYGGDGGYCFIDQLDPDFKIVSYVYNSYYYTSGGGFGTMLDEDFGGFFINPAAYDSKVGMLYSSRSTGSFYRSTVDGFDYHSQSQMGRATHFAVSPYAAPDTSTIFVGTVNGKVWKFVNASDSSQFVTSTELTYSGFPNGSISCIAIGSSEDELLVTFSNYNTASVWYTGDGGDNWEMVEGNLPDMPVRWALFNPLNWNQVLLATELGTWSTINIHEPSVNWTQSINGMENVRVNMLRTRNSDNQVVAATFGRGLFTSFGFQEAYLPIAGFESTENQICLGQFVTLKDTSTHVVDSREWIISPNTVSFINGTDSTSKFPQVEFNIEGDYTIKLVVTNVNGSDSITYTNFISAVELDPEIIHNFNPDKLTCSITANSYQWFLNGNVLNGETNQEYFPNTNGTFRVEAILNEDCSEKSPGFVLENFGLNDLSTSAIDLWYSNAMQSLVLNLPEGYTLGENQLTVTDANGRMVYQEVVENTEVSMQALSPGVYFAKISAENTKDTGLKFIVR